MNTQDEIEGRRCVRLQGKVRLENNGGFIQLALDLQTRGAPLDVFRPERLAQPLDRGSLTRLGVVAYGRRFLADLAVARVALYG